MVPAVAQESGFMVVPVVIQEQPTLAPAGKTFMLKSVRADLIHIRRMAAVVHLPVLAEEVVVLPLSLLTADMLLVAVEAARLTAVTPMAMVAMAAATAAVAVV
jgi:hypothetical protein